MDNLSELLQKLAVLGDGSPELTWTARLSDDLHVTNGKGSSGTCVIKAPLLRLGGNMLKKIPFFLQLGLNLKSGSLVTSPLPFLPIAVLEYQAIFSTSLSTFELNKFLSDVQKDIERLNEMLKDVEAEDDDGDDIEDSAEDSEVEQAAGIDLNALKCVINKVFDKGTDDVEDQG